MMESKTRPDPVDVLMEIYVDWREESAALEEAYRRWSTAPEHDRPLAFAAYKAALDREEWASVVYGNHYERARTHLGGHK
jgi:hypothetical protein